MPQNHPSFLYQNLFSLYYSNWIYDCKLWLYLCLAHVDVIQGLSICNQPIYKSDQSYCITLLITSCLDKKVKYKNRGKVYGWLCKKDNELKKEDTDV